MYLFVTIIGIDNIVVVHGVGGFGIAQLILEYLQRYRADYVGFLSDVALTWHR